MKIYKLNEKSAENISFGIYRMEDIYDRNNGEPDSPHTHDFYTILLVLSAAGKHIIDFNEFKLSGNQIYFLSPGQVHQMIETEKSFGYCIVFSKEFLIENHIPLFFFDELRLFNNFDSTPPLQLDKTDVDKLTFYCNEILSISESAIKFKQQAVASNLSLILIRANNNCNLPKDHTQNLEARHSILKKFITLVDVKYKEWHLPANYARELNISPDYLNRVVKTLLASTSAKYIQSRIIIEAKRLLWFSGFTAKEIGYNLGFNEPTNFSAFFKKLTGMSPSSFRESR